jgi:ADP-ribose pyrophosphatase YjhB (NUDIX family)
MIQGRAILTTGAVIFNGDNQVLLVRHTQKASHLTDTYGIPAGRPDHEESLVNCCIREVKEETGLILQADELSRFPYVFYSEVERKDNKDTYCIVAFITEKYTGKLQQLHETEPLWVDIDSLQSINLLGNLEQMIKEAYNLRIEIT